jgi:hypothetical protein
MDKNEILKKAQSSKKDEMETYIEDKSYRWIYVAMVLSYGFFAGVRAERNEPIMDLTATMLFAVFGGYLYKYIKTKDKAALMIAILCFVFGILATVRFFMGH